MAVVDRDLLQEIEQFLYREARLLDEGKFHDWLALFTDDVRYWLPIRETLQHHPDGLHPDDGLAVSHMDDDKDFLTARVKRLDTGVAHAETPPSRTRHFITNVEVEPADGGELNVYSNFLLYQSRREKSEYLFSGRREDRLRKAESGWMIARRKIVLDQALLPRAISVFF